VVKVPELDEDVKKMIIDNWNENIDVPRIELSRDVRLIDLQNDDYIVIHAPAVLQEFLGIGAKEYLLRARIRITVRSSDLDRAKTLRDEVLRITRNKELWGGWLNLRVELVEAIMDKERKLFSYIFELQAMNTHVVQ
jgi:hypothetical protein